MRTVDEPAEVLVKVSHREFVKALGTIRRESLAGGAVLCLSGLSFLPYLLLFPIPPTLLIHRLSLADAR